MPKRRIRWVVVIAAMLVASCGDVDEPKNDATTGAEVGGDLHSLVADPRNAGRIYVGGHQAVTRSNDGGKTWTAVATLDNADAMGWGFVADTVFVSGHPGLNRSDDAGQSFQRVNDGLPNTDVHAFGAGAAVLYGASPAVGVFASTDGGRSWTPRTADTGQSFFGRIIVDSADDNRAFAADVRNGVMASGDGGRTWTRSGLLPSAVWLSGGVGTMLASGPAGAARTNDGGGTWELLELPDGAQLVEASPTEADVLYAAGLQGTTAVLWVSRDGGTTWRRP